MRLINTIKWKTRTYRHIYMLVVTYCEHTTEYFSGHFERMTILFLRFDNAASKTPKKITPRKKKT